MTAGLASWVVWAAFRAAVIGWARRAAAKTTHAQGSTDRATVLIDRHMASVSVSARRVTTQ
jgi:hypothetical protein